jgi:endo-1,3-1,4-beta-glycanase ExoK
MEFIGVSPHMIQTNFFSRWKDPGANSASGNEVLHHLGFNANDLFAAYAFKWTHSYIAWYVNGRPIRIVWSHERQLPSPSYSTMRIAANAWVVNKQAEEWAGPVAGDLTQSEAKYAWMSFTEGGDCQPRTHC